MSGKTCDVAIVGSGFSGLEAANILAARGLSVLLLDESIHTGGQLLRSLPWPGVSHRDPGLRAYGFQRIRDLKRTGVEVISRAKVLDISDQRELLVERDEKEILSVRWGTLLLATGAREKFVPFKGWTLPGVISTGAAQILMKGSGMLPAREMLVSGTGPFLLALSAEFLKNHGRPVAVLDMAGLMDKLRLLAEGFRFFSKLTEGSRHLAALFMARVPVHHRTAVLEAQGRGRLEKVLAARRNRQGAVMAGTERSYRVGCLAVGWGFTPNIELAQQAGCAIEQDAGKGGWAVKVKADLETTVERVFAAGEITGVAGALKSILEGRLAAQGILRKLGREVDLRLLARLQEERIRHLRFGVCFNRLHEVPAGVFLSLPDEVTLCRCEDVTMGDIRRAVAEGYDTPAMLKRALRTGMGNCQGRTCGPLLYDILVVLTNKKAKEISPLSVRGPVKAVAIRSFLSPPSTLP